MWMEGIVPDGSDTHRRPAHGAAGAGVFHVVGGRGGAWGWGLGLDLRLLFMAYISDVGVVVVTLKSEELEQVTVF